MKKLFIVLAIGAFAACNNAGDAKTGGDSSGTKMADTSASKMADTTSKMMADTTKKAADTTTKK